MNTSELLEQCQLRLLNLDSVVDRIRNTSVGNTWLDVLPLAPPPSPTDSKMPGDAHKRAVSRCHELAPEIFAGVVEETLSSQSV